MSWVSKIKLAVGTNKIQGEAAIKLIAVFDQIIKLETAGSFLFINGIAEHWKRIVKLQYFFAFC